MRITCPNCTAEYEVPSARLTPNRKVRCIGCGTDWRPVIRAEDPAPTQAPPPLAQDEPYPPSTLSAMDRLAAVSQPRSSVALRAAWVATGIILAGAIAAAITWRTQIVYAWPPSARVLGQDHAAKTD